MEYRHIICPVDGSPVMDIGLSHASYICRATGADLIMLHVVEKWYRLSRNTEATEDREALHELWLTRGSELLDAQKAKLASDGFTDVVTVLREGDASHEIVALAVERKADLIVLATHRYAPAGKLFMGSVIDRVTRKSPCPIMWVF